MNDQLSQFLDRKNFVDRVVYALSANEGSLTAINPNDAGYGISIGIRQWNQKAGELPSLLRSWHTDHPEKFERIFAEYSQQLLDESWVRQSDIAAKKDLMSLIKQALADPELQQSQVKDARRFVKTAAKLGIAYGFTSELLLALIVDLVNQKGRGGAEKVLRDCGLQKTPKSHVPHNEATMAETISAASNRAGGPRRFQQLKQAFSAECPVDPAGLE